MTQKLARRAFDVFQADLAVVPSTTLRSADAIDSYAPPIPYDPVLDEPTDAYLERYTFWGQTFLDAASWRHYLPRWIDYAVRHATDRTTTVVDGLLASLRPPDREPPRLASLTAEQEASSGDLSPSCDERWRPGVRRGVGSPGDGGMVDAERLLSAFAWEGRLIQLMQLGGRQELFHRLHVRHKLIEPRSRSPAANRTLCFSRGRLHPGGAP